MALKFGNTTISDTYNVKFNGNDVEKIYFEGTLVWEKYVAPSVEYEDCWKCLGDGGYACTLCDKGYCQNCGGEGTIPSKICSWCNDGECWNCGGTGSMLTGSCSHCGGGGSEPCGMCNRTGIQYVCNSCGTPMGKSGSRWYCGRCDAYRTSAVQKTCTHCGGMGHFGDFVCTTCNGTGKNTERCTVCNGIGGPCSYCNGNHYISGGTCSNCGGSGFCPYCDLGVVTCTVCRGSGQIEAFKTSYDASSGNVTMTLRSGDSLDLYRSVSGQDEEWALSANFDLQVITILEGGVGPCHWGSGCVYPSYFGDGTVKIYDCNIYDYDDYPWSDGNLEAEFIMAFGTCLATLSYDQTAQIWYIS